MICAIQVRPEQLEREPAGEAYPEALFCVLPVGHEGDHRVMVHGYDLHELEDVEFRWPCTPDDVRTLSGRPFRVAAVVLVGAGGSWWPPVTCTILAGPE